jgi:hypothetical protein
MVVDLVQACRQPEREDWVIYHRLPNASRSDGRDSIEAEETPGCFLEVNGS